MKRKTGRMERKDGRILGSKDGRMKGIRMEGWKNGRMDKNSKKLFYNVQCVTFLLKDPEPGSVFRIRIRIRLQQAVEYGSHTAPGSGSATLLLRAVHLMCEPI